MSNGGVPEVTLGKRFNRLITRIEHNPYYRSVYKLYNRVADKIASPQNEALATANHAPSALSRELTARDVVSNLFFSKPNTSRGEESRTGRASSTSKAKPAEPASAEKGEIPNTPAAKAINKYINKSLRAKFAVGLYIASGMVATGLALLSQYTSLAFQVLSKIKPALYYGLSTPGWAAVSILMNLIPVAVVVIAHLIIRAIKPLSKSVVDAFTNNKENFASALVKIDKKDADKIIALFKDEQLRKEIDDKVDAANIKENLNNILNTKLEDLDLATAFLHYQELVSSTPEERKSSGRSREISEKIDRLKIFIAEKAKAQKLEVVAVDPNNPGSVYEHRYYLMPSTKAHGGTIKNASYLDKGGMAEVYVGWDLAKNRQVAIKCLRPDLGSDDKVVERFKREYRNLKEVFDKTKDVNLKKGFVQPLDFAEVSGNKAIVMEFVPWPTIDKFLEGKYGEELRDPRNILKIGIQLCQLVENLHNLKTIHRDIKPNNIFIDYDPDTKEFVIKLSDLGIAKSEADSTLTTTGAVLGTPNCAYPPYLFDPKNEEKAKLHDIFGIGSVLYYIASGGYYPVWLIEGELIEGGTAHSQLGLGSRGELQSEAQFDDEGFTIRRAVFPPISRACCQNKDTNPYYNNVIELRKELEKILQGLPGHTQLLSKSDLNKPTTLPGLGPDKVTTAEAFGETMATDSAMGRSPLGKIIEVLKGKDDDAALAILDDIPSFNINVGKISINISDFDENDLRVLKTKVNEVAINKKLKKAADIADYFLKNLIEGGEE